MLETFKKAGIQLNYCPNATVPQIPRISDVLYVLRLKEEETYFSFGCGNHPPYVTNVLLVAAAVAYEVLSMRTYDEIAVKKIIAQAIFDLCPEDARCLFNTAFMEAASYAEKLNLAPQACTVNEEPLRSICSCARCQEVGVPV